MTDFTTYTDADLSALALEVREEQDRRTASQTLNEAIRVAVVRASALGLDSSTVSTVAGAAVSQACADAAVFE